VTNLGVHDVLHVSDIATDERIEILASADTVIATVGIVKEEAEAPVAEGEATAEPELIAKGKKEDEAGEPDKGKKE
jgi:large subunit ribosomal protein L25